MNDENFTSKYLNSEPICFARVQIINAIRTFFQSHKIYLCSFYSIHFDLNYGKSNHW